ncbi:MAG TPA: choice-of-anchor Q domain-containing protein [bacterium]|nr:choice-of-anchor Q domain-containing protein [bacterium]
MSRNGKLSALVLSAFLLAAFDATAANLTATPTGGDCSGGTGGLQECLDVAVDNGEADTITLEAGTYNEGTYTYNAAIPGEDFSLTLAGPAGGGAIIDGEDTVLGLDLIASGGGDSNTVFTIQGLTFVNGADDAVQVSTVDADTVVEDSVFRDNNGTIGGALNIQSSDEGSVTVRNSTFSDNFADSAGGGLFVSVTLGNVTIENNLFERNSSNTFEGGAINVETEGVDSTLIIANNVFSQNESGADGGAGFLEVEDTGSAFIINNTIVGNTAAGDGGGFQVFADSTTQFNVYNNIFFENSAGALGDDLQIAETGAAIALFNNLYSEVDIACNGGGTGCISEGGNIVGEDPLFVDSAAGDFHLTADSPARDSGDPAAPEMPSTDFDGNPRPDQPGTNPDMGAFEFQAPIPTPTPTPTPTVGPQPEISGGGCNLGGSAASAGSVIGLGLSFLAFGALRRRH